MKQRCRTISIWHQSTARAIRKHQESLLSVALTVLRCHTAIGLQRCFKSNTPLIVLGKGPCSVASSSPDLAPPKNYWSWKGEKLFNGLTPQLSTTFTVFVTCFSNAFLTFIMHLQTILRIDFARILMKMIVLTVCILLSVSFAAVCASACWRDSQLLVRGDA